MERKHTWKGEYTGRELHGGLITRGRNYTERDWTERRGTTWGEKLHGRGLQRERGQYEGGNYTKKRLHRGGTRKRINNREHIYVQ